MDWIERILGAEEDWRRPGPTPAQRLHDVWIALGFLVVSAAGIEVLRPLGVLSDGNPALEYAGISTGAALLVFRRSHPLTVAGLASAHLLLFGTLTPMVSASLAMQVLLFFAIYSGVAWARERRAVPYVALGIVVVMFAWLAWFFAFSTGLEEIRPDGTPESGGLLPPVVAGVLWVLLNNVIFFAGAIALGQIAWRGAQQTAQVLEQAQTIAAQTSRLRDQAVVAERLRIARELHDVVAHHVSVMGVQAAAARRVLTADPAAAASALTAVETSSRDAVAQMRGLLGTLRAGEEAADAAGAPAPRTRAPQPGIADLPDLVAQVTTPTWEVRHTLIESVPGAAPRVPAPVQLSVYRVVQEALANVRRHSTARHASAVVRVEESAVEIEVVDDGRPRPGTSGTGLGHLGMRERAQHLGGGVEVGPRVGEGYRVRVWFPIDGMSHPSQAGAATPAAGTRR